ncbi:putative tetratricopeptide-like helical domain superfamily [Helianthus annuus]|uniref:Tetratricopeptide-like helical domain superfamily n=1 Tax=Helianthus annuus TaxID=4232 RepID=A0A9K3IPV5_HELAN|nr:putative tetratricopeptide-like helical domain superfamily [Helianthus annuus]KAJ0559007.1 putative tetratricopeptide-like helical domain superfamily [Helianthus annuus]KAJ0564871.1 putative tetratricopeptide-like helical domain superfamily [Helianthus annuus]KAJ0571948.1 putative tetratricopeptide-like helical domain superfamily [Helianthus annuus]KAJ0739362.1 putative tetratricopeptide-like helical domain superfamily [Helianthus annuus]
MFLYSKCAHLYDAHKLFDEMPVRDTISFNTIISGCFKKELFSVGFEYFKLMWEFVNVSKMIHTLVVVNGHERETTVANTLITAYFCCGCSGFGRQVFVETSDRNVVTWTAMISGLAQNRYREEGCQIHGLVLKLGINTDFTLGCFSFIFLVFTHNLIYCFCTFHFSLRSLHYKYKKFLCYVDLTKDFFFSYSYHVMQSL